MVCFATAVAPAFSPPRYAKDELALCGDWKEGMVALYSSETLEPTRLALLARLLSDIDVVLARADALPVTGGWSELGAVLHAAVGGQKARKSPKKEPPVTTGDLPHEDSSSGSDSDDD